MCNKFIAAEVNLFEKVVADIATESIGILLKFGLTYFVVVDSEEHQLRQIEINLSYLIFVCNKYVVVRVNC